MGKLKRRDISPSDWTKTPTQEDLVGLMKVDVQFLPFVIAAWPYSRKERKSIRGWERGNFGMPAVSINPTEIHT